MAVTAPPSASMTCYGSTYTWYQALPPDAPHWHPQMPQPRPLHPSQKRTPLPPAQGKPTIPGARHCPIVLPKGLVQFHTTPLALGKVCLPHIPHHASLRPANLVAHRETQVQRMQWEEQRWYRCPGAQAHPTPPLQYARFRGDGGSLRTARRDTRITNASPGCPERQLWSQKDRLVFKRCHLQAV